jgi:hypothetical protein
MLWNAFSKRSYPRQAVDLTAWGQPAAAHKALGQSLPGVAHNSDSHNSNQEIFGKK